MVRHFCSVQPHDIAVTEEIEGWCTDPYARHETRSLSEGKSTDLVRDQAREGRDPVPDEPFRVAPVPLREELQGVVGLERADDPRSWELLLPISERADATPEKGACPRARPFLLAATASFHSRSARNLRVRYSSPDTRLLRIGGAHRELDCSGRANCCQSRMDEAPPGRVIRGCALTVIGTEHRCHRIQRTSPNIGYASRDPEPDRDGPGPRARICRCRWCG